MNGEKRERERKKKRKCVGYFRVTEWVGFVVK